MTRRKLGHIVPVRPPGLKIVKPTTETPIFDQLVRELAEYPPHPTILRV